nr:integrase, catalytic region, zinc finger, CCHC-type, peptidase aspartic, catalytic [Tanacetum cinerariifolium]
MIPEPGDPNREVPVNDTFHVQTDDELTEKELKQIEADDQAIQTILLEIRRRRPSCSMNGKGLLLMMGESIESYYHHFLKLMNDLKRNKHFPEKIANNLKFLNNLQPKWSRHKEVDELKAERLAKTHDPLALMTSSKNRYTFPVPHQDQPSFNQNFMQQPMPNPKDITDPTTAMNMALALMAKAFKLNYSTTNNNKRISSNPRNRQIAQPGMNMGQDRQMQMVRGNGEIQFRQYAGQNNPRVQNIGNQNGRIGNPGNANHNLNGNGNLVAARAEDLDEIEEVNANCILMVNLQQASTSGTQPDKAPVYDSDRSSEVHKYEDCYNNNIFNMFTQEEQYTELLKHIPESHQEPHNDNNVISEVTSVEQSGGIVEQHPANVKETCVLYDSLYNNLAIEVQKVNTVNRNLKETNTELTTELARFKNQEKYDKLERCYQQPVYQEQCHSKKINALHLSSGKQIMNLNEEISDLNKQLSKENSTGSFLLEEKKRLKSDFKTQIKRLLKAVVSQNIISVVQNNSVVDTSNLKTELERTKERFENCIIKKENEYAKLWNDWYKKCEECKFDKILYDKAYNDMQQKIEWLQAQLRDLKGKSKDTSCVSDTLNPLSRKLENENVELEFQLRAQLFNKVSDQKDNTRGTSANTKFAKQSIMENLPKVIAPGMFRINPFKPSRKEKHVPRNVSASIRTKPITISQPPVITKKVVNFDSNGLSSIGVDNSKPEGHSLGAIKRMIGGKKQMANVSIKEKQKKQNPKVKKPKKVGSIERLATPKPSKPRSFLRLSPTGRLFDLKGKIIASSKSESQSDCSTGDNACTFNSLEPTIKRNLKLLVNLVWKFLGTVRFGNDHVAAILGFYDLQWGNILITRVYLVEGLGHNLFSVGQFCDSDLEVAFKRNACFIINLEGVDLLKRDRSTNLYTINLHDMASASPI